MATGKIRFAVLVKPGDKQPAIERAVQYAKFAPDIEVVAIRIVNDFTESDKEQKRIQAESELDRLKREFPGIAHFEKKIIFNKNVADSFVAECNQKDVYSLAIISANKRNTIKDLFVSTIDSTIMRSISIPLLVVKDVLSTVSLGKAIVVAIDFEETEHLAALDEYLFKAASLFAEKFNGEVHVVNCVPPVSHGISGRETEGISKMASVGAQDRFDTHEKIVQDFAEKHKLPEECVHVVKGRLDEEIPRLCVTLQARMVCMGTTPRSSFLGAMDSIAGELVLEQIRGDLFIVNSSHLGDKGTKDDDEEY